MKVSPNLAFSSIEQLKSKEDSSVNFIFRGDFPGYMEARYVRREPEYFIAYLSSQTGCQQACRMCHLTTTGQTALVDIDKWAFISQAQEVLDYYKDTQPKAKVIHYSFMARGEPLANAYLIDPKNYDIFHALASYAFGMGLHPRFCISTIMPKSVSGKNLIDMFPVLYPDFYYSIYSAHKPFRDKWLNHALPVDEALEMLIKWQDVTKKIVKLHWAYIKGQNDSTQDAYQLAEKINSFGLRVDINIVRYNPYSEKYGEEPSIERVQQNIAILRNELPKNTKIKVVPRVGFDAHVSCGCFYE